MRATRAFALAILLAACSLATLRAAYGQLVLGVSVNKAPPPLPVYDQPPIPAPGYLWVPGYWAWSEGGGYYWVPGTWILPPKAGLVWTPEYWGSEEGVYVFHVGYWGSHIGFYGGVDYGFGYDGIGYQAGYWKDGRFLYNNAVNNITNVSMTNVYSKPVAIERRSNASFNGGKDGTTAKATSAQLAAEWENHIAATSEQRRHAEAASKDPALSLSRNHGCPAVAATAHAGLFKGPGVVAARTDKPIETLNSPAGNKATPVQGNGADYRLPSSQGNAAGATSTGLNEHNSMPGAKPLERQNVKLIANAPQHAPSPPLPAASVEPQTGKLVTQALRPASPPSATRPRPPTKPKCPPGQQHC
jgi:hypothetical protein